MSRELCLCLMCISMCQWGERERESYLPCRAVLRERERERERDEMR